MDITLKLSKDFERCLEDLKKKYGEDFEYINGVHPSQLDFSEFIDNFVDKDTLADASIDPNANANHKDIRSFMTEKAKSETVGTAHSKTMVGAGVQQGFLPERQHNRIILPVLLGKRPDTTGNRGIVLPD